MTSPQPPPVAETLPITTVPAQPGLARLGSLQWKAGCRPGRDPSAPSATCEDELCEACGLDVLPLYWLSLVPISLWSTHQERDGESSSTTALEGWRLTRPPSHLLSLREEKDG